MDLKIIAIYYICDEVISALHIRALLKPHVFAKIVFLASLTLFFSNKAGFRRTLLDNSGSVPRLSPPRVDKMLFPFLFEPQLATYFVYRLIEADGI